MTYKEQARYRWSVEWGDGGHTPAFSLEDARKLARKIRKEGQQNVRVCKRLRAEENTHGDHK